MVINDRVVQLNNGKIKRIEDDWSHSYWSEELGYVPGVTTILDEGLPTPFALRQWWQNSSVKDINERLNEATGHGSNVHSVLEQLNNGETIYTKDENGKYVYSKSVLLAINSYRQFLAVWQPEQVISEQIIFYRDEKRMWAGTVDLICKIDGKWYVIDFKTGKVIDHKAKLQVIAYKHGIEQALDIKIEDCLILQLGTKHRNLLNKPTARSPFILGRTPQGEGWQLHTVGNLTLKDFERVYDTWLMVNNGKIPEPPKVVEFPDEITLFTDKGVML